MLHAGDPTTAAEEASMAYKHIETVTSASTGLIRPPNRLAPLRVVKG